MIFRLNAHHFRFRALDPVYFPPGKAGNVFRGALGTIGPAFPPIAAPGPSGLADPPRPFVLRAAHLDGRRFEPGDTFTLDVHVFDRRSSLLDVFLQAFPALATQGLGPRRGRVELLDPGTVNPIELDLTSGPAASACTVRFLTPTELKGNPAPGEVPFSILFARVRDRIATLRNLYGEGPLPVDFQALAERANLVHTVRTELARRNVTRRSSRTGMEHGIGGVTGHVDYAGDLAEFLPWLRAAWWTGVGRHTVWGNGVIEIA